MKRQRTGNLDDNVEAARAEAIVQEVISAMEAADLQDPHRLASGLVPDGGFAIDDDRVDEETEQSSSSVSWNVPDQITLTDNPGFRAHFAAYEDEGPRVGFIPSCECVTFWTKCVVKLRITAGTQWDRPVSPMSESDSDSASVIASDEGPSAVGESCAFSRFSIR